jgi:hypothetical protein
MKLILDFDAPNQVYITASDDPLHSYCLAWKQNSNLFSLWYDGNHFVWEKEFGGIEEAVGLLVINLLSAMRKC